MKELDALKAAQKKYHAAVKRCPHSAVYQKMNKVDYPAPSVSVYCKLCDSLIGGYMSPSLEGVDAISEEELKTYIGKRSVNEILREAADESGLRELDMEKCETCKWWYQPRQTVEVGPFPEFMWPCEKMPASDLMTMINSGPPIIGGAYVGDGCCGPGQFVTHKDFGCVMHEKSEITSPRSAAS